MRLHPGLARGLLRRLAWLRLFRPRLNALVVLVLALVATGTGFALARQNQRRSDDRLLHDRAAQLSSLFDSTFQQIGAVLGAGAAVADATDGDPAAFERTMAGRVPSFVSTVSLVGLRGRLPVVEASSGRREPVLLRRLTDGELARLRLLSEASELGVVRIATSGPSRVIAVAVGPTPGRAVYAEILIPAPRAIHGEVPDILYAVYYGTREAAASVVATTAAALPLQGRRVTTTMRLGREELLVVVSARHDLAGGLAGAAPALVLAFGALAAVALAVMVESRRRRREALGAQTALEQQNELLREVDRMKDDFVAVVSHELRTPLTSILGYAQLLDEDGSLGAEQRRLLGAVDRNARRLLDLVGRLLVLAQVEAGAFALEREPVGVPELLRECVAAERMRAQDKGIEIALRVPAGEVPRVAGDRARLAEVFENLLSNAVKFTPPGGRVDVAASTADGLVLVEVSDTGVGVPEHEQAKLFDRFYRASTAGTVQGTGLGLAIAKAIVDGHGGSIAIASREAAGATFRVELPLQAGGAGRDSLLAA